MQAPDYADPDWWSLYPGAAGYAASVLGSGRQAATEQADIFYIHPTTTDTSEWNQADRDERLDSWTDRSAVIRHLDPFVSTCRLFAPRYRQAGLRALRCPGANAEAAWNLAYEDVRKAFYTYVRTAHDGRPFILFGHSQGALHASRLLAEVVEADGLQDRLIAAYIIGIGVSEGLFGRYYKSVTPCIETAQTGCVISWNSFLRDADTSGFIGRTRLRDERRIGGLSIGMPTCTNPLSYAVGRPVVAATDNPGTLTGQAGTVPLAPLVSGLVGAACEGGVLRCDPTPPAALGLDPLPGGSMHMHDIALFHAALRDDARRRIKHALSTK